MLVEGAERRGPRSDAVDAITVMSQDLLQEMENVSVVLHDEDP